MKFRGDDSDKLKMLGEKLRTLREDRVRQTGRKLYQRDVAKLLGIKEETYRSYEYGRAQLPPEHAKTLGAEWGVQWQEFYRATGLRPPVGSEITDLMHPEPQVKPEIPTLVPIVKWTGSTQPNARKPIQCHPRWLPPGVRTLFDSLAAWWEILASI